MILISKEFNSSEKLADYINLNNINKEDIQQITNFVYNGYVTYTLFYWAKEMVEVNKNKHDELMFIKKEILHSNSIR